MLKLLYTDTLAAPFCPRLVVMSTTPLAAREPYWAAAAAPLMMLMLAMSLGLRSAMRFWPGSARPTSLPTASCDTLVLALLIITPSMTYSGSEGPSSDFTPRSRMEMEPAGSPEFCVICAPDTLPCSALMSPPEPLCTKSAP